VGFVVKNRTVQKLDGTELESEALEYRDIRILSTKEADAVPELSERVILRNNRTYTTSYRYNVLSYGDFHQPFEIIETGDDNVKRTTTRTFEYEFTPFITGKVSLETVSVDPVGDGDSTFEKRWTYDHDTGFTLSATIHGITTTFAPDAQGQGNVGSSRTGNGHTTTFTYDRGLVRDIITPKHTTSRTINGDEMVPGATTSTAYWYDADTWRAAKGDGATATFYLRDVQGALLTEWRIPSDNASTTRDYIYAGSRLLVEIVAPGPALGAHQVPHP